MGKRIWVLSSVAAILLAGTSVAWAQNGQNNSQKENNPNKPQATTQGQTSGSAQANESQKGQTNGQAEEGARGNERAFLGVRFEPVPRTVASQMSGAFPQIAHGALIENVLPNSPAAKAGLERDDIVTEVNNKPLRSADELMHMISHEKAGQKLSLQVVRGSKTQNVSATLGEGRNSPIVRGQEPEARNGQESENGRGPEAAQDSGNESAGAVEAELESFDAMSLERTGKDQYKTEIKFRDKQGKIDSRTFQGSREQIRKDIMSQTDLPKSEQRQLLGSLRLPVELEALEGSNAQQTKENSQQPNTQENNKSGKSAPENTKQEK